MKSNKLIPIILLIIISINNFAISAEVTKISKNKITKSLSNSKSKTKTSNKSKADFKKIGNDILAVLNEGAGEKLFFMLFGALSAFFPELNNDTVYNAVKGAYTGNSLADCFKNFQVVVSDVKGAKNDLSSAEKEIQYSQAYCEKVKQKFKDYHKDAVIKFGNKKGGPVIGWLNGVTNPIFGDICKDAWTYVTEQMKKDFNNDGNKYLSECKYFMEAKCETFRPEHKELNNFSQSAWSVVNSLWPKAKCVAEKMKAKSPNAAFLAVISGSLFANAFSAAANLGLNIITLGIWGGVKAAYGLVMLGIRLQNVMTEIGKKKRDANFIYGELLGSAALIVKNLIAGRRRKLK